MQKPVVKAILFDLDGTLVDTIEDIRRSLAHALAGEGLPPPSANLTRQVVGSGLHNALKGALSWFNRTVGEDRFNQLYQEMLLYYREHYAVYSHPYEGVGQLLQHLLESGYALGVYSNKEDGLPNVSQPPVPRNPVFVGQGDAGRISRKARPLRY
jgi:phosphoglycolate phosphatase